MADFNEIKIEAGSFGHELRTAQPTSSFRFFNGELQQAWLVVQHGDVNQEVSREIEWRAIPREGRHD